MASYYKIGDFAKKLGVTSDFLKYYENLGIIKSVTNESGYRLYRFPEEHQKVLECLKLKNSGFSAKEIAEIMQGKSLTEYISRMNEFEHETYAKRSFYDGVIRSIKEVELSRDKFFSGNYWEVCNTEGFYFVPYAVIDELMDESYEADLILEWLRWLPITHYSIKYSTNTDSAGRLYFPAGNPIKFGLFLSEESAKDYGIITQGKTVDYIPPTRNLVVYLRSRCRKESERKEKPLFSDSPCIIAENIAEKHNLTIAGNAYSKYLTTIDEDDFTYNYQIVYVPIKF